MHGRIVAFNLYTDPARKADHIGVRHIPNGCTLLKQTGNARVYMEILKNIDHAQIKSDGRRHRHRPLFLMRGDESGRIPALNCSGHKWPAFTYSPLINALHTARWSDDRAASKSAITILIIVEDISWRGG